MRTPISTRVRARQTSSSWRPPLWPFRMGGCCCTDDSVAQAASVPTVSVTSIAGRPSATEVEHPRRARGRTPALAALLCSLVAGIGANPAAAADRPVLDGRWDTKFSQVQIEGLTAPRTRERRWVFRRYPSSKGCKLRLSYELALGGFGKVCLKRRGSKYLGRVTYSRVPCGRGYKPGRIVERFSVRVLGSDVINGTRSATSIEAYYRASYAVPRGRCAGNGREVRHYRGERIDLPGDADDG